MPSPWLVTSALDIPLETAGKRGYRLAQAAHLSEVARLNIASVAWQVRSRLRTRLAGLFVAQETVRLLRQQQAVQAENVRILAGQLQAGAISAFEATQGRIASDTTQLALREAERQQAAIKKVKGVVDTLDGLIYAGPTLSLRVRYPDAQRFGLTAMKEIEEMLGQDKTIPPGTIEFGGLYQQQRESFRNLMLVLAMAISVLLSLVATPAVYYFLLRFQREPDSAAGED